MGLRSRLRPALASAVLSTALACATGPAPEFRGAPPMDFPEPDAVDAVLFLVGDAGAAHMETSPVLRRMRAEVEFWAERLARDSAVTVAFLGDNVYPEGVRGRDHPLFPEDSLRLWSQIRVLDGPFARRRGALGVFLAGNHDWGNTTGEAGVARLRNQASMLEAARAGGIDVRLLPEPGEPGPSIVDVRENARVMIIDTHWYLQSPDLGTRVGFFQQIDTALARAEERHVIMLAHHPYRSAGPHGLLMPGDEGLGLLYLLRRSGTLVQDLNSPIYRDFRQRLDIAFEQAGRSPLVFASGHDHSLQVLDPEGSIGPRTILVSGAGSKLTDLTSSPGLRYAASRPGYMTLIFRRNEAVDLYVVASPTAETTCASNDAEPRQECLAEATASMELVYSERLAPAASLPDTTGSARAATDTAGGSPAPGLPPVRR